MIDYYKAIDTETGEILPYLEELSHKISKDWSAERCFRELSIFREELEGRRTLGSLDDQGQKLQEELPNIRSLFMSDHQKIRYDRELARAWEKRLEVSNQITRPDTAIALEPGQAHISEPVQSLRQEAPSEPEAIVQLSRRQLFLLALAFIVLLSLMILFNLNIMVLLIGLILIVALILLMS